MQTRHHHIDKEEVKDRGGQGNNVDPRRTHGAPSGGSTGMQIRRVQDPGD